jgi:hypothetical protein
MKITYGIKRAKEIDSVNAVAFLLDSTLAPGVFKKTSCSQYFMECSQYSVTKKTEHLWEVT